MCIDVGKTMEELEACLKKSQRCQKNFQCIVEMMPVPVLVVNTKTDHIVYVNPAFCLRFGYSEEELLDHPCDILCPKDMIDTRRAEISKRTEENLESDINVVHKHFHALLHKSGSEVELPSEVYNWRNNGDRFYTMVFVDRRKNPR